MKKRGFLGQILYIALWFFIIGFGLAFLSSFDWDIIAMLSWIINFLWNIVLSIAEQIQASPIFQKLINR